MTITKRSWRNVCLVMLAGAAALLASACVTKTVSPSTSSTPSNARVSDATLAPSLVIEQFMRASNSNDLDTMGELFGNKQGPFNRMGSKKDNDDRMFTFASVLRHTDFSVKGEGDPVSGRRDEAKNIMVEITRSDGVVTVPFLMVRYKNSWLIEDICLNKLLNPREGCKQGR